MQDHDNRQAPREPLSIDATGGDWIKPPVRLGDDGSLYVRDPDAVSGTRRVVPEQVAAEVARMEDRLRERLDPSHELHPDGAGADSFRGTLWWQAATWALDEREGER